jgi:hypothetical protein
MVKTILIDEKETELEVYISDENKIGIEMVFLGNRDMLENYSHIELSVEDAKILINLLENNISEISN